MYFREFYTQCGGYLHLTPNLYGRRDLTFLTRAPCTFETWASSSIQASSSGFSCLRISFRQRNFLLLLFNHTLLSRITPLVLATANMLATQHEYCPIDDTDTVVYVFLFPVHRSQCLVSFNHRFTTLYQFLSLRYSLVVYIAEATPGRFLIQKWWWCWNKN